MEFQKERKSRVSQLLSHTKRGDRPLLYLRGGKNVTEKGKGGPRLLSSSCVISEGGKKKKGGRERGKVRMSIASRRRGKKKSIARGKGSFVLSPWHGGRGEIAEIFWKGGGEGGGLRRGGEKGGKSPPLAHLNSKNTTITTKKKGTAKTKGGEGKENPMPRQVAAEDVSKRKEFCNSPGKGKKRGFEREGGFTFTSIRDGKKRAERRFKFFLPGEKKKL